MKASPCAFRTKSTSPSSTTSSPAMAIAPNRKWSSLLLLNYGCPQKALSVGRGCREPILVLKCFCGDDRQVLAWERQVCAVPKGRRGPDRLLPAHCSNGASSRRYLP